MNYQTAKLPEGSTKVGSTPSMTEETVVTGILKKHLAPKGKYGYLVVEENDLDPLIVSQLNSLFNLLSNLFLNYF